MSPGPDPTSQLPTVASRFTPISPAGQLTRVVRLVRTNTKYAFWRIEEIRGTASGPTPPSTRSRMIAVADHVIVRTKPGLPRNTLAAVCARHGATIRKSLHLPDHYLVAVPEADLDTLPNLMARLNSETSSILYAEPDHIVFATQTFPNDPSFTNLWGLHNTGQSGGKTDADIDAPEAWDISQGSPEMIVGVIDSGVDLSHPDLASNIWTNPMETANGLDDDGNGYVDDLNGWDFLTEDNSPSDANSHGTHCAGTIAAIGNNDLGVAGLTWRCKIMPLRFLDASGSGTTSDAMEAILYATDLRRRGIPIRLTSNSWGGGGDLSLSEAIRASGEAGMLFVAAAGNSGSNNDLQPFYPASYSWDNIISVAATDRLDERASFSCYGANSVDLAAPGSDIYSTVPGGYGSKSGTSMATPHVAALAALLWSERPEASPAEIRTLLFSTVDPLPSLAGKMVTGGRINARKALEKLFRITHSPAGNRINTGSPYVITASIAPPALADTNQVWLYWNQDESTNFLAVPMEPVQSNLFQASIPTQPEGSTISYWLKAVSLSGLTATHPSNAPGAIHRFTLMPSVTLEVTGTPGTNGPASPDYGLHILPSNMEVTATAVWHTTPLQGARWACLGWTGTGDTPESGSSNSLVFTLDHPSTLEWRWTREFGLDQTTLVAGVQETTTWWQADSTATTLTAPESLARQGTNFMFVYWNLDGARQPSPEEPAVNPIAGIPMGAPRKASALYVSADLDADADTMPDWWELRFFGTTNAAPESDDDGDGFSNLDEYRDHTSPRSTNDAPVLPLILHTPLEDPMPRPAPYTLEAYVADNFDVADVMLFWIRSGNPVQSIPMTEAPDINQYSAIIPAPGTNGDVLVYWITASDPLGQTATNGPHTVHVSYPLLQVTPHAFSPVVEPQTTTNQPLSIKNLGNAVLDTVIQAIHAGYSNTFDSSAGEWVTSGTGGPWNLSSNRFISAPLAWYCGNPVTRRYSSSMHARLDSPPFYLGSNSVLSFNHWIKSELDTQYGRYGWKPNHAWDGGIVEISTNSGVAFHQIAPLGGYSHAITGWSQSPWPSETPCFAGSGAWSQAVFDLGAYSRKLIILRFHFGTDSNTEDEGWYIDNVVISPSPSTEPWLSWHPTNLSIQAYSGSTATISFAAGTIPTGDREAALVVTCNDPVTPSTVIPIHLRVRSKPLLAPLTAAQTSTNGEGWVTLSTSVQDKDGDPCSIELEWTTNSSSWGKAWIRSASPGFGSASTQTSTPPQVTNILTTDATQMITNSISLIWDTSTNGNNLGYTSSARIRARPIDSWMSGTWQTSALLTVDNVAPPAVPRFTNLAQSVGTWSPDPSMNLFWRRVTDIGTGLAGYRITIRNSTLAILNQYDTTETSLRTPSLPDGSNWWASVSPRDLRGNLGPAVTIGPYAMDTMPPSATSAVIHLDFGPGRTCLVASDHFPASWAGFSDSGSGISGYFCALAPTQPLPASPWNPASTAIVTGVQMDLTNVVQVWAIDKTGWISPPATRAFLALSAGGDWDRDGMPNLSEGTAGTDPANSLSLLRLETQANPDGSITLSWPAFTNRLYTLAWHDTLLPADANWLPLTNCLRISGMDGRMMHTDQVRTNPARFYRLTVEEP